CITCVLISAERSAHNFSISVCAIANLTTALSSSAYSKTLVSTKDFSLIEFVPRRRLFPSQIQALFHPRYGPLHRLFVTAFSLHELFNLNCYQRADRRFSLRRQNLHLLQQHPVQLQRDIRLFCLPLVLGFRSHCPLPPLHIC